MVNPICKSLLVLGLVLFNPPKELELGEVMLEGTQGSCWQQNPQCRRTTPPGQSQGCSQRINLYLLKKLCQESLS